MRPKKLIGDCVEECLVVTRPLKADYVWDHILSGERCCEGTESLGGKVNVQVNFCL